MDENVAIIVAAIYSTPDRWTEDFHRIDGNVAILCEDSDGEMFDVVSYYSDEHDWNPADFVGLTRAAAGEMIHSTYVRYFRGY